jgi:hypothetical protein
MRRRIGNWVTGAVAGAFLSMVAAGVLYLNFSAAMASYDAHLACNPGTGISRLEWLLGVRAFEVEHCRR